MVLRCRRSRTISPIATPITGAYLNDGIGQKRPLSVRGRTDLRFDVLSEGIPAWMEPDVSNWVWDQLAPNTLEHDWRGEDYYHA